ncbi:hypothetical protein KAH37_09170, partial [bacterium]|nr:hypothetical protein [bacterium]
EGYCTNLGGRMPTISELRLLIQNCPSTEVGGSCKVSDECSEKDSCWDESCRVCGNESGGYYSVFGFSDRVWSSTIESVTNEKFSTVWVVNFYSADVLAELSELASSGDKQFAICIIE